jgi:hypothetical protein
MKNFRSVSMTLLFVLLLGLVPASMAQDMTFGLSQEDFAALTTANAMSASATSATYNFTLALDVAGDGENVALDLTGDGVYGVGEDGQPLFSLKLAGTMNSEGADTPVDLEIRLTEGNVYFNSTAITGGMWQGMTQEEFGAQLETMTASLPVNPEDIAASTENPELTNEVFAQLATLNPEDYVAITNDAGHFTVDADIASLMSSEQMQAIIAAAAASSEDGASMSEAELAATGAILSTLFEESVVRFEQYVGADNMIERSVATIDLNIDPAMMGQTGDPVVLNLVFDINLSGYNQPVTVEAPADAMMMPAS